MELKPEKRTDPRKMVRPDEDDLVHAELNLERWAGLWATRDSDEARVLTRRVTLADGRELTTKLTISPQVMPDGRTSGTLVAQTRKLYLALTKLMQEAWGRKLDDAPEDNRLKWVVRQTALLMDAGKGSRSSSWGGKQLAGIKRHIRKLSNVGLRFEGEIIDANNETKQKFERGFHIVSDYLIAAERKFQSGAVQMPLDFGYVKFSDAISQQLKAGKTAPVYLTDQAKVRGAFAANLYQSLNLKYGSHQRVSYKRKMKLLFEEDFPEMGHKYPYPADRKRVLTRACKELVGRRVGTGVLTRVAVQKTNDGSDYMLVTRKRPFPTRELPHPETEFLAGNDEDDNHYRDWSSKIDQDPEQVGEAIARSLRRARQQQEEPQAGDSDQLRDEALLDQVVEQTADPHSRKNYARILKDVGQSILWKWVRELDEEMANGSFTGTRGQLLQTKYKQFCAEQGREPYWRRTEAQKQPENNETAQKGPDLKEPQERPHRGQI